MIINFASGRFYFDNPFYECIFRPTALQSMNSMLIIYCKNYQLHLQHGQDMTIIFIMVHMLRAAGFRKSQRRTGSKNQKKRNVFAFYLQLHLNFSYVQSEFVLLEELVYKV